jgi:hypothetical protein
MENRRFNYQDQSYEVMESTIEVSDMPRVAYVCSLCGKPRGERDRKVTIRADADDGKHLEIFACNECTSAAYKRHPDLTGPLPKNAVTNAIIAELDPEAVS